MTGKLQEKLFGGKEVRRIHFIGIGGMGMSGLARIMIQLGYRVGGSDVAVNNLTRFLLSEGAEIYRGHDLRHIRPVSAVVYSSAISPRNPELRSILHQNLLRRMFLTR